GPPPTGFAPWALGGALLGVGTAMVYPTLLAAIGDVAHPNWRARSVGIYRLWRDGGFACGAVPARVLAPPGGHPPPPLAGRRAHRGFGDPRCCSHVRDPSAKRAQQRDRDAGARTDALMAK